MLLHDTGTWTPYVPSLPEDHPLIAARAAFLRNEDGNDWYATVAHHADNRTKSIIITDSALVVEFVACEAERACPKNKRAFLIEDVDYATDEAMVSLLGMRVDLGTMALVPAPPAPITSVTRAQAKIALYNAGLLPQVEAMVAAHPYAPVRIWYADALHWERTNPYLSGLALDLGLTQEQIDALFTAASLL